MVKCSIIINSLFCLCILFSCTSKINIDLNGSDPILVVDAHFTTDTTQHLIILSKSSDYYSSPTDSMFVSGATIYVEGGGKRYYFKEESLIRGYYKSDSSAYGIMGEKYFLHISGVDMDNNGEEEIYTSESYMPYITEKLDSIKAVYGTSIPPFFHPDPNVLGWSILMYALDPPTDEYYAFSVSINGKPYDNTITKMVRMPDDFTQGLYINGLPLYFFPDNNTDSMAVTIKPGDRVSFVARSITETYNTYISDIADAIRPSNPMLGGSPSNVRGNISNGAFGCFAVYSVRRASTTVGLF